MRRGALHSLGLQGMPRRPWLDMATYGRPESRDMTPLIGIGGALALHLLRDEAKPQQAERVWVRARCVPEPARGLAAACPLRKGRLGKRRVAGRPANGPVST